MSVTCGDRDDERPSLPGLLTATSLAALAAAQPALAQAWPAKQPIRLVAVFPPGGSVDQVALATTLIEEFVDNVSRNRALSSTSRVAAPSCRAATPPRRSD